MTLTEERRGLPSSAARLEIRNLVDAAGDTARAGSAFRGYAAVYNQRAAIGNPLTYGFFEQVAPGAFTKTLQEHDQRFLVDHNSMYVVSRVSAGTLALLSDGNGLAVDSRLDAELSYVRDLMANVRNGNITGMSFGFQVLRDEWVRENAPTIDGDTAEVEVRTLIEVRLVEVSAVTFPAYTQTAAELNSVATALIRRGDYDAIERRAAYKPELLELCRSVRAPGETTRDGQPNDDGTTDDSQETAPGETTRSTGPSVNDRMRALAARYHLPVA